MPNDRPDWLQLSAPQLFGAIVANAGQNTAVNTTGSMSATQVAILVDFETGDGARTARVTRITAQLDPAFTPYFDLTFPVVQRDQPQVVIPFVGDFLGVPPLITVYLDAASGATATYANAYYIDRGSGWVYAPAHQPLPVQLQGGGSRQSVSIDATTVTVPVALQASGVEPYPVLQQVPSGLTLKRATINSNLNNNGTAAIVAAVAGQVVTVWGWELTVSPSGVPAAAANWQAQLQDSGGGNAFANCFTSLVTVAGQGSTSKALWLATGLALPSGLGVRVIGFTGSATAVNAAGTLYYTQG